MGLKNCFRVEMVHTGQQNIFIPTRLTETFSSCSASEISLTWPPITKNEIQRGNLAQTPNFTQVEKISRDWAK